MTPPPDRLLAAYLQAAYEFTADDGSLRLRPGERGGAADAWLRHHARQWGFITACNPRSSVLCEEENKARHENLERELGKRGWRHLPARGRDLSGKWPDEPGFLVLDRPVADLVSLAERFGQAAVVFGDPDHAPKVVVLESSWRKAVERQPAATMAPAPNGAESMLTASGLGFTRDEDWIFRDLDFRVTPGRVLLAEGPNGSGKTTLVRVLAGLLEFHAGELNWKDEPVHPGSEVLRDDMLYLGHRLAVKEELTALENLVYLCGLHGQPASETECDGALVRLGLAGLQDTPAMRLSAGQRKRVALARLVLEKRPLWLLDEPYANLDREGAATVSELITRHAAVGGLTVLTAHEGLSPAFKTLERLALGGHRG